ncbi:molybdopterin converting factor subunit 1 [Thalassobaculum sp. OXR-137]|uniref:molybdopterin converting factor subunit 1 n=1 Tax=Thalassobaculum sp. OXR-137 TaxID=3100173 RepID=UPI002AC9B277|nr:molybdopterin converting factor subunit 1 [Thalassobaculum sp. OXR-137]WPZ36663.1 molybdopterin converting factor subunit 1 [Thalassobaculum sp. OXR-137]
MKLMYFAWVRQRIGSASETVEAPAEAATVGQLVDWLKTRGPGYAEAFKDTRAIRYAVNQEYVEPDHPVAAGDEVAFFPPVTGG